MLTGIQESAPEVPFGARFVPCRRPGAKAFREHGLKDTTRPLIALGLLLAAAPVSASIGIFGHGDGMKAMGMGGTSYSHAEEATALAGNPAHALALGHRLDVGLESLTPSSRVQFRGNSAGPDAEFTSTGRRFYPIPQGGYTQPISDRLAWGVSLLSAGLGPIYPQNPYERFGGGSRSKLFLVSAGLVSALSYRPHDRHTVGFGVTLGRQSLELTGLEFLAPLSEQPDKLTDQGKDSVFSIGFTLGWLVDLAPDLKLGLVYRSKAWTEKHEDYAGAYCRKAGGSSCPPSSVAA